jgi:hypothetical protein
MLSAVGFGSRAARHTLRRTAAGLLAWLTPLTAQAETSVHLTGAATAAYTDNAFSAPKRPIAGQRDAVATPFFLLTPGLALYHDRQTAHYQLSYQHDFALFLESSADNFGSDTVRGQGLFELSARDTLTLSLSATRSSFARLVLASSSPGATDVQTGGTIERLRVDLVESYAHQLDGRWRLLQTLQAGTLVPFTYDEPVRYQTGIELGVEYARSVDSYGLSVGTTYFKSLTLRDRTVALPVTDQLITTVAGRWQHELSPIWSSNLDAGVGVATELGGDSQAFPVAGAGLTCTTEVVTANLGIRHSQFVSLESAQTYVTDSVNLGIGTVISEERPFGFNVGSSLGHNRQLVSGGNDEAANVWLSEVSVGYAPTLFSLDLRAQHFEQFGGGANALALPDMARNVVMLTLSSMFPARPRLPARQLSAGEALDETSEETQGGED